MAELEPPTKRHLSGRRPTHSSTASLASNFSGLHQRALVYILVQQGYMRQAVSKDGTSTAYKPTRKALDDGLIDTCSKTLLWNLQAVQDALTDAGMHVERASVNQDIKAPATGEPQWVNLGTLATYFNTTANQIGKWLDELGYREPSKLPSQKAIDESLSNTVEMNAGGKKTRKVALWNLYLTQKKLLEAGHELDFDYNKTLKGTGRNSDVTVSEDMNARVRRFVQEFTEAFKDPDHRYRCIRMVKNTPKQVLKKAEQLMNRPGFLTQEQYKEYIRYR